LIKNIYEYIIRLFSTLILGFYFTLVQFYEYKESFFCISDSVFGSTFFLITGFHGLHVIIGTIFLTVIFFRSVLKHFSEIHHFGFEAAI